MARRAIADPSALAGRRAPVTGASRGLAAAMARALAGTGVDAVPERSRDEARDTDPIAAECVVCRAPPAVDSVHGVPVVGGGLMAR